MANDGRKDASYRSLLARALDASGSFGAAMADGGVRAFCGMGVCFECEREVDGVLVRTCLVRADR